MDPTFDRRRPPNESVVAIRTRDTRTLGFFMPNKAFVAIRCGLSAEWHADEDRIYDEEIARVARLINLFDPDDVDASTDVEQLLSC